MISSGIDYASWPSDLVLSLSAIAFSSYVLCRMFLDGIRLKQCGILTGFYAHHMDSIAVAISRIAYRSGQNYLALAAVRNVLTFGGLPGAREAPDVPVQLDRQPAEINKLLNVATKLQWPEVLSSGSYVVVMDQGYVDYATTAFRLFGIRIQALYYQYFVILGGSCVAFWAVNLPDPAALWSLALMLLCLRWFKLHTTLFDESGMNYVYSYYFVSTLVFVPAFHIGLGILSNQAVSVTTLVACVVQCAFLWHSTQLRASAAWAVLALVAIAVTWTLLNTSQVGGLVHAIIDMTTAAISTSAAPSDPWSGVADTAQGIWMAVVAALFFSISRWRYLRRVSPVFAAGDVIDCYPRYHGAYLGFAMDPETWEKNLRRGQIHRIVDMNGVFAAKYWLLAEPGRAAYFSALKPQLNDFISQKWEFTWRGYEKVIRLASLDYARKNLRSMPKLYLYLKPKGLLLAIAAELLVVLKGLRREQPLESVLLAVVGSVLAAMSFTSGGMAIGITLFWMAAAAPAPQIWAYTIPHFPDEPLNWAASNPFEP